MQKIIISKSVTYLNKIKKVEKKLKTGGHLLVIFGIYK